MLRHLRLVLGAALLAHLTACGTILYPERRGQKEGRIDPGVAVLDAVGLLFFIIPGVIAFAVDFGNGAIYLPKGGKKTSTLDDLEKLKFLPGRDAKARIEAILKERTGLAIKLDGPGVLAYELGSPDEVPALLARAR